MATWAAVPREPKRAYARNRKISRLSPIFLEKSEICAALELY